MRNKLIITGAVGVMAAATLTVNAQNAAGRAMQAKPESAVALLARTVSADRDDEHLAVLASPSASTDASTNKPTTEESAKPEVETKASPAAISSACTSAIANLKALHLADVAEDATERASASGETTRDAPASNADRTEDLTEAQQWLAAVKAAHAACVPATATTNCQTAIAGLQPVIAALRAQEQAEAAGAENDMATDISAIRGAFSTIAMACARPE